MSDHCHDCPKCGGYFVCDKDNCSEDDKCLECLYPELEAENAKLKDEIDQRGSYAQTVELLKIENATLRELVLDALSIVDSLDNPIWCERARKMVEK